MIVADAMSQARVLLDRMFTEGLAGLDPFSIESHLHKPCQIASSTAAQFKNTHPRAESSLEVSPREPLESMPEAVLEVDKGKR